MSSYSFFPKTASAYYDQFKKPYFLLKNNNMAKTWSNLYCYYEHIMTKYLQRRDGKWIGLKKKDEEKSERDQHLRLFN